MKTKKDIDCKVGAKNGAIVKGHVDQFLRNPAYI